MNIPFYNEQVRLLFEAASWRNEWLDQLFNALYYFDTPYFLMILIPFVWVGFSYKWGMRLAFALIVNGLVNFHLKHLFNLPRPIVDYPDLAMFPLTSPGMPSGAAQLVVLLSGLLIMAWKSRWAWAIAVIAIPLISFSRLYLGIHYPMDILGGWIVGLALVFAFVKGIDPLENYLVKQGRGFCLIICCVIGFCYIYLLPIQPIYQLMGAWLGFGIGAYLSLQYKLYLPLPKAILPRIYRGAVSALSLFIIYVLLKPQAIPFLIGFAASLWISLGAGPFCRFLLPATSSPSKKSSSKRSSK